MDASRPGESSRPSKSAPRLITMMKRFRVPILVVGHLVLFCLIYLIALAIRFEKFFPEHNPRLVWFGMPLMAGIKLTVFFLLRNFHGWWRYVTFSDLLSLARAATMSVLVIVMVDHFLLAEFQVPRNVIVIDWAFTIAVLAGLRSVWRIWDESLSSIANGQSKRQRALLIGSDQESARLAHLINSRPSLEVKIVGLVSPSKDLKKSYSDLRVVGHVDDIGKLANLFRVDMLYVAAGRLTTVQMRQLMDLAAAEDLDVNVIPKLASLLEGGTSLPIRKVNFEDLLRRPPVNLDKDAIGDLVTGQVVMVTGAGGSIGSEICRQLIRFKPGKLILAGRGENRLYHINRELRGLNTGVPICCSLLNLTDEKRGEQVFAAERPAVVFHAAAHKHVPLTEGNVGEAVINNVYGTKVVADLADRFGVREFVLVSTDKAVNPTSVMGATKQLAERYCLALGNRSKTRFVATRFGNVLGSAGSVVPLFQEQIKNGGPITITHPDMTRYFMTIPEASQLVIQAAAMGRGGEIFVLEMGSPVKIVDLANDLVRLAGLPAHSVDIEYTGIRAGEKLYEELYYHDEESLPTAHPKILTAYHRPFEFDETCVSIESLISTAYGPETAIRQKLKELVPEYGPRTDQIKPAGQRQLAVVDEQEVQS